MTQEQFNLNWHTYSDHLKEMMQNLLQSTDNADVTLVCQDKTKFKAHKFVLRSCSTIFQSIIMDMDMAQKGDSVIYLRGVRGQEMKFILQFMYYGQATLYQDRMSEFLNVAKSLEVKEISKDVECHESNSSKKYENDEYKESNSANSYEKQSDIVDEVEQTVTEIINNKTENGQFSCSKCGRQYSSYQNLYTHIKSAHEGKRYPCNRCDKSYPQKIHLQRHVKSTHEGVRYQCDLCDDTFSYEVVLIKHKRNKH